jgi:hypothetical protein
VITLIHQRPWQALAERLDALVAGDQKLAAARALVATPITLLAALAEDVEGALGDDRLALERLRALLSLSAVHSHPFASMRALLADPGSSAASSATPRETSGASAATTILDYGGMVLVGLAAARAGADTGLSDAFVDHALTLILSATPAEALSRAIEAGLTDSQLRAALAALGPSDTSDRHLSISIASFVADPAERARWRTIDALFALIRKSAAATPWEGATSEDIVAVTPPAVCAGGTIEISVRLPLRSVNGTSKSVADFFAELAAGKASVVFASAAAAAVAAKVSLVDQRTGTIRVALPAKVHAGWVGVTSPALVAESNDGREQLRKFWTTQNKKNPVLANNQVQVSAIANLPPAPSPPRTTGNRFTGGLPTIELLTIEPELIESGIPALLRWRVGGADSVNIDRLGAAAASGSAPLAAMPGESVAQARLTAANVCGEIAASTERRVRVRIADVRVCLSGSERPPQVGHAAIVRARLTPLPKKVTARLSIGAEDTTMQRDGDVVSAEIPAGRVTRDLTGRVRVFVDSEVPDDEQPFGPLDFEAASRRRVVIVRPAVLTPEFGHLSIDEARAAIDAAARELGVDIDVIFAPLIDAAGFAIDGVTSGAATPSTRRLLERLNLFAARSTGFEDALWVALVPADDVKINVSGPGDTVSAIAVASPAGLADLLREETQPLAEPPTDRLRLMGTLDFVGAMRIIEIQRRRCPAGTGSSVDTGMKVVGLDRIGREIAVAPLRLAGSSLPARFVALLAVAPELARIEIRLVDLSDVIDTTQFQPDPAGSSRWVAKRIDRTVGEPTLSDVRLVDGELHWEYEHTRGVLPDVTIELGRDGGWWTIQRVDRGATSVTLALDRLPSLPGDRLRVVASDRWNTAISDSVEVPESAAAPQVIARYAGGGRFWVDLGGTGGKPRWQFGRVKRAGPVVTLPEGFTGSVELEVRIGSDVIKDTRVLDILRGRRRATAID